MIPINTLYKLYEDIMPITIELDPNIYPNPNVPSHQGGYDDTIIPSSIQKIYVNGEEHPIDAITLNSHPASDFQEGGKIVSVSASSQTDEMPSAKSVYEIIYGSSGNGGM